MKSGREVLLMNPEQVKIIRKVINLEYENLEKFNHELISNLDDGVFVCLFVGNVRGGV